MGGGRAIAVAALVVALLAGDAAAHADDLREAVSVLVQTPRQRLHRVWTDYVPAMPIPESRSSWTSIAVGPSPFDLTSGEALTPRRGRIGATLNRISDERFLIDLQGRTWDSDGEVNVVQVEYVSPALPVRLGRYRLSAHLSASMTAYSLEHGVLENIRNWVEEDLLFGDPLSIGHDIGGRDLIAGPGDDLLNSAPLLKLRVAGKLHLPRVCLFRRPLDSALSLGLTMPSFGWSTSSGNGSVQPDVTLAYRLRLSRRWALHGASTLMFPSGTERFDQLGIDTESVLFGTHMQGEYWFSRRWAIGFGVHWQSGYFRDTGLPMDVSSFYGTIGFMFRPHPCHVLHIVWSENLQTGIPRGAQRDFSNSQTDSDFALQIGWRYSL